MPTETDTTQLEARIVELENALKALTALREPVNLSADEIKAYLKVRDAIACADWPTVCVALCGSGPEACVALCGSGTEACGKACVLNCGSGPIRCLCRCGTFSRCGFPCSRCGCDTGYSGGGGLARFSDLGS
jgi:hypothetical protein